MEKENTLDRWSFWGIPMTSRDKTGDWYAKFRFHGKMEVAALNQMRPFSVKRLYNKMGEIDDRDMSLVSKDLSSLLFNKKMCPSAYAKGVAGKSRKI